MSAVTSCNENKECREGSFSGIAAVICAKGAAGAELAGGAPLAPPDAHQLIIEAQDQHRK